MTDDTEWSDDEVKKEMLGALQGAHPEDVDPADPFKLDALGHEPEEEDSMGGENNGEN